MTHTGERYEVGLTWKANVKIENNYAVAKAQLKSLQSRLSKDNALETKYQETLQSDLEKGYVKPVVFTEPQPEKIWYLPHHPVCNPKKPGKVRRVANAAASYRGQSLNDNLLSGPDLLQNMFLLLLRFREQPIAVMADIEAMFMQISIREEDQAALRFLWFTGKSIRQYQYTRLIFGAACSPTTAIFARKRSADDFATNDETTKQLIHDAFYMDDLIHSFNNTNEAARNLLSVKEALCKGGFNLTKFVSNDRRCLEGPLKDHTVQSFDPQRVLGIHWDLQEDNLFMQFDKDNNSDNTIFTLRKLLSLIASVYDPLGFVAPAIVTLKILLQEVWRTGISWDESLPILYQKRIQKWLDESSKCDRVCLPRCMHLLPTDKEQELHVFTDASQLALGTVAYLRNPVSPDIKVTFVMGRSKVAPLKQQSIPRLELDAAVLGVRLSNFIQSSLRQPLSSIIFWTDSTTVLNWIKADSKQKIYVSRRVEEILEKTKPQQWKHVPGSANPADHATRGIKAEDIEKCWLSPPEFLLKPQNDWFAAFPSAQKTNACISSDVSDCVQFENFSSWNRLLGVVARLYQAIQRFKDRSNTELNAHHFEKARNYLFLCSQKSSFAEQLDALSKHKPLSSRDKLLPLAPFLDENGLLRATGRLTEAPIPWSTKHPLILNTDNHITRLFINHCHEVCMHAGVDHVRNFIQQSHYIFRLRSALRSISFTCFKCRRFRGQGLQPFMSSLPTCRFPNTDNNHYPFRTLGIDFIGPFEVVEKRHTEKRYVCLFTCLVSRAVHFEVADSLSQDSCMSAIRRFVARRGVPELIFSDNATNFLGAKKEIRRQPLTLDENFVGKELARQGIQWRLNPPSAPHFGGVWERLVQPFKRAFLITLGSSRLTREVFDTITVECESLLNSRPLTHVSSDIKDATPITPNHFLLGRPCPNVAAAIFGGSNSPAQSSWRRSQDYLNSLWKRLLHELTPQLIGRPKWNKHDAPLKEEDLVWILNDNCPRGVWPLGIVEKAHTGPDGVVRSCLLRTALGKVTRPAVRLSLVYPKNIPPHN